MIRAITTQPTRAAIRMPMIQPRVPDSGRGDIAASVTARSQHPSVVFQVTERAWLVSHKSGYARCRYRGGANDVGEISGAPRLGHKRNVFMRGEPTLPISQLMELLGDSS